MSPKGKKLILLIFSVVLICINSIPVSAATSEDSIQLDSWKGKAYPVTSSKTDLCFYSGTGTMNMINESWAYVAENRYSETNGTFTKMTLTNLGSFTSSENHDNSYFDGCTTNVMYDFGDDLSGKIVRVPLNWYWAVNGSSDKFNINTCPFSSALDYCIQFKVVVRCDSANSVCLTNYPLYGLFYDNESGTECSFYKEHGGYWRNFYVKRFTAASIERDYSDSNNSILNGYYTYSCTFKLVVSGSDMQYCRDFVFQFPAKGTNFWLGMTDCYINVYDPVYDALTQGAAANGEYEKQEAQNAADKATNEADGNVNSAINSMANPESVSGSFGSLFDVLKTSDTNSSWVINKLYIPAIDGVMDRIDLLDEQEISFDTYIQMIPENIMTIIRALTTIALIIFCIKELYGIISYVLTLNKGGGTE